jgi:hypothetical protein
MNTVSKMKKNSMFSKVVNSAKAISMVYFYYYFGFSRSPLEVC